MRIGIPMTRTSRVTVLVAGGILLLQPPAHAYLDPGSGSMLLQVLLGGFAAVGVVVRLYWQRLSGALRRKDAGRVRR